MEKNHEESRRIFLKNLGLLTGAMVLPAGQIAFGKGNKRGIKLGFVTYLWGKDWDQDTLIRNLTASKIHGVELRVEHAHKVSPALTKEERILVRKKFSDSPVQIVGMGNKTSSMIMLNLLNCANQSNKRRLSSNLVTTLVDRE